MQKNRKSIWMMVASMVVFGTLAPFVRSIAVSSGELALYRAVMAALLIGAYLWLSGNPVRFRQIGSELPRLLLSGMAMGINWILLFEAYRHTTVVIATLSYYFAPVIVTLVCPLLFREKLTVRQIICFVMSTIGVLLILGVSGLSGSRSDLPGILLGLGAAAFYATVILLNKSIRRVQGLHRTFLQFSSAIVILIPYVLLSGGFHLQALDTTGWVSLLIVGVVHTGICYCMYFSSLRDLRGQQAAILSYIDPMVAVLISVLFLHEALTLPQIIGGALILGFSILNECKE